MKEKTRAIFDLILLGRNQNSQQAPFPGDKRDVRDAGRDRPGWWKGPSVALHGFIRVSFVAVGSCCALKLLLLSASPLLHQSLPVSSLHALPGEDNNDLICWLLLALTAVFVIGGTIMIMLCCCCTKADSVPPYGELFVHTPLPTVTGAVLLVYR